MKLNMRELKKHKYPDIVLNHKKDIHIISSLCLATQSNDYYNHSALLATPIRFHNDELLQKRLPLGGGTMQE